LEVENCTSSVAKGGTVEDFGEMDRKPPGKWCFVMILREGRQAEIMPVFISIMLSKVNAMKVSGRSKWKRNIHPDEAHC
jgi:hypothetical protein